MLEVGRIAKVHGLRGEVVVQLSTDRLERVEPGSELFATPAGTAAPEGPGDPDTRTLVVEASRPHGDRWLVRFQGCARREDADALRGLALFAEPLDLDEVLWVHELVGATVQTTDGRDRGRVTAVQANPASDLLVLDSGALVPIVFVVAGPDDGRVVVDVPEGLFELTDGTE